MNYRMLLKGCSLIALSALPQGAWAQADAAQDDAKSEAAANYSSSDIIVTANRRSESVNKVGMAISAVSADSLSQSRIQSADDLPQVVPGLTVAKGSGVPVYTLRGIGFNTTNLGSTGTVGTYVNEVAYPYPLMASGPIFDLERVEVLKGPQGTLYGRNTTGGLIDQITAKPGDAFAAGITAEVGNYETYNLEGFVNLPVGETLSARLAVRSENSDKGWQKSASRPGERLGEVDNLGLRGSIKWEPDADLKVLLTANYWQNKSDPRAGQYGGLTPRAVNPPTSLFLNPYYGVGTANPLMPFRGQTADWLSDGMRQRNTVGSNGAITSLGLPGKLGYDQKFIGMALHLDYALSDSVRLVSITSYNHLKRDDVTDIGGTAIESAGQAHLTGYIKTFAEELRIQGDTDSFSWLAGAYYGRDRAFDRNDNLSGDGAVITVLRTLGQAVILPQVQAAYPGVSLNPAGTTADQIAAGFRSSTFTGYYRNSTKSLFGSVTWRPTEQWAITGGIRYSIDDLKVDTGNRDTGDGSSAAIWNTAMRYANLVGGLGNAFGLLLGAPAPIVGTDPGIAQPGQYLTLNSAGKWNLTPLSEKLKEKPVTWRLNVNYTPNSTTLLYASVSDGTKSGTVPVTAANSYLQLEPVKQERLRAYEVGVKAGLFDRLLQANVSAFYYDYKNKQLTANLLDPVFVTLPQLQNVPKAKAMGLDWDFNVRASRELSFGASGTYVHTKVTRFSSYDDNASLVDFKGARFSYAPKLQLSGRMLLETPVSEDVGFRLSVNASYQSSSTAIVLAPGDVNAPLYRIPAFGLVNGQIGIYGIDKPWTVSVWGKNLTDHYYWSNVSATIDAATRLPGMARTFGITLSHRFN